MPSTIALRRKIKSVRNTRQITKAMQMVAASKMRRAQEAVVNTRAYAELGAEIMERLQKRLAEEQTTSHTLFAQRESNRIILVVITSDKGLAGSYNSNVIKEALAFIKDRSDRSLRIITIGRKGEEALKRAGIPIEASFTEFPNHPTSNDITPIALLTIKAFIDEQCDQVSVIFTQFHSTIKQTAQVKQILPLTQEISETDHNNETNDYQFEPNPERVLDYVVSRLVEVQLLQTLLESIASEHSARMLAMKNATDNANEMIGDLTLTYNGVRQASITQEIAEISAGANAAL
jgi:F-type H+-transporting ATPase subunit gamma